MNPIVKFLTSAIIAINKLIDTLSLQTIQTIKRGFFFAVFIFCIIGIIIGINIGKNAAKIKSAPLAEFVNDTFRIDLNREKDTGDFSEMLENEVIKESTINNFNKAEFPVQDKLEPQYDKEPIDARDKISAPDIRTHPYKTESPIDEDLNRTITEITPEVRALEKNLTDEGKNDIIINRNIEPEKNTKTDIRSQDKSPVRILEKDKTNKPEVFNKDSGIINQ
jgi:hypothetical protein